jgi:deoxycytidylate deaminase
VTQKHTVTAIIRDKRGRVLSVGQNSYVKTHPKQAEFARKLGMPYKEFLHAEIHSIVRCADLSKAHSITVYRYNRQGEARLAKPCAICEQAILASGIRHIYHT